MDSNQKVKDLDVLLKELGYVDSEGKLTESGADALVRFVPIPKELEDGLTIGDTDDYHISLDCDKSFDDEGKVECFGVSISGYLGEGNGTLVLAEKEDIVAIRDYLNKFLEHFFEQIFDILERSRIFAVSYNLIGKRKPAIHSGHFLCLNELSL